MHTTYRVLLAYHGAPFAGYRRQPDRTTVEGVFRTALTAVDATFTAMAFAGATDRGVHAWGQVVSFRAKAGLTVASLEDCIAALEVPAPATPTMFDELDRALDGRALVVRDVVEVTRSFHASFSARSRRYRYRLRHDADARVLDAMVRRLEGTRDVRALARRPRRSTRKTILRARVERDGAHLCFDITASGFLRRQMRVLVATAFREVEAGACVDRLVELCATEDPRQTARPAAPEALCLWEVDYDATAERDTSVPSLIPSTSLNDDQSSASSADVSQRPSR